jgi:hypothetical protein
MGPQLGLNYIGAGRLITFLRGSVHLRHEDEGLYMGESRPTWRRPGREQSTGSSIGILVIVYLAIIPLAMNESVAGRPHRGGGEL